MNQVIIIMVVIIGVVSTTTSGSADQDAECPGLYKHTFRDSVPRANLSAGVYSPYDDAGTGTVSLRDCVLACCGRPQCNVALWTGAGGCYHVTCISNELCLPQSGNSRTSMVLVKPVNPLDDLDSDGPSWADVLLRSGSDNKQQRYHDAFDSLWRISDSYQQRDLTENDRADTSDLLDRISYSTIRNNGEENTDLPALEPVTVRPQGKLHVIVKSKEVQLPENNVTLVAQVQELDSKVQYQYEWNTLQQPDGQSGAIRSQQDNRLELSHLSQGLYMFNVTVSSKVGVSSGWALANVSVLGAVRVNEPPTIVITPNNQTVRLPNTAAILDASATIDDVDGADKVQYHWELKKGPLGYQPTLTNTATLQLSDLTQPGQYTFQVAAVDSEGAQATALAYVTVLPPIDYPPTADAGADQVLYLPLNDGELVLSGNGSTDDHDIVSWEWTRVNSVAVNSSDTNANNMQAVDMRDTRTPMLRLGRIIEPGVYTFQLRVQDISNQTSTAQVRLFVKEREENGQGRWTALAVASNGNVTLPVGRTWILLDGRNSTVIDTNSAPDDSSAKLSDPTLYYKWDLLRSPSNKTVQISSPHEAISNVTGLTVAGFYQFRLQVSTQDTLNTNSSIIGTASTALVNVTVKNPLAPQMPPHAVATIADSNVQLPRNAIYLNASESISSADSVIVSYTWHPCVDSPLVAAMGQGGSVAEGTDKHPVLVLVLASMLRLEEAVEVCWNVTVRDREGLTDWATVRFNVMPDAILECLVEILIGGAKDLTSGEYSALLEALESLDSSIHIHVRTIVSSTATSAHALLTIYATTSNNDTLPADDLTNLLLLHSDRLSAHFYLISVRPASCRSVRCSGHGHCDAETRTCHCQTLWMPNMWMTSALSGRDCSWSVLYVTLAGLSAVCGVLCVVYLVCCRCCYRLQQGKPVTVGSNGGQQKQRYQSRRSRGRNHNHSYTLINNTLTGEGSGKLRSKLHLSDSDSDVVDRTAAAYSAAIASGDSDDDRDDNVVFNSLHKMPRNNNKLLL